MTYPDSADEHYHAAVGRNDPVHLAGHLEILRAHEPGGFRLYDHGCGRGWWVKFLRERGIEADGWDPNEPAWQAPVSGQYGVVTMIEVIEHLGPDLRETMAAVSCRLVPTGLLYMTTKLWTGDDPRRWWYVNPGAGHISILTRTGMEALAAEFGLQVVSLEPVVLLRRR